MVRTIAHGRCMLRFRFFLFWCRCSVSLLFVHNMGQGYTGLSNKRNSYQTMNTFHCWDGVAIFYTIQMAIRGSYRYNLYVHDDKRTGSQKKISLFKTGSDWNMQSLELTRGAHVKRLHVPMRTLRAMTTPPQTALLSPPYTLHTV